MSGNSEGITDMLNAGFCFYGDDGALRPAVLLRLEGKKMDYWCYEMVVSVEHYSSDSILTILRLSYL